MHTKWYKENRKERYLDVKREDITLSIEQISYVKSQFVRYEVLTAMKK
jgi:hypothetical protein